MWLSYWNRCCDGEGEWRITFPVEGSDSRKVLCTRSDFSRGVGDANFSCGGWKWRIRWMLNPVFWSFSAIFRMLHRIKSWCNLRLFFCDVLVTKNSAVPKRTRAVPIQPIKAWRRRERNSEYITVPELYKKSRSRLSTLISSCFSQLPFYKVFKDGFCWWPTADVSLLQVGYGELLLS